MSTRSLISNRTGAGARLRPTTRLLLSTVALTVFVIGSLVHASIVFNGASPNGPASNGQSPNGTPSNGPPASYGNGTPNGAPTTVYPSIGQVLLGAEGLNFNALLTNRKALAIVVGQQLGPGLLADPYIRLQLTDSDARGVFRYMYGCACAQGQALTVPDNLQQPGPRATMFVGELGLAPGWCGKGGPAQVTERQRELVSACVAGRVNVLGSISPVGLHNTIETRLEPAEAAEFREREAAFYGNLFGGPDSWVKDVEVLESGEIIGKKQQPPDQSGQLNVFPNLFSCVAAGWSADADYARARLCASDLTACVGTFVGSCANSCAFSPPDGRDPLAAYASCADPSGTSWPAPLTSFVRDRCAFSPDPKTCLLWRSAKVR